MRTVALVLLSSAIALPAQARPGLSIGIGLGGTSVGGETVGTDRMTSSEGYELTAPAGFALSTDIDGGVSPLVTLSYNILGYAAVETRLSGHGHDLGDETARSWAAHWHTGVRAYPMWHWQQQLPDELQAVEPSIFVGWGASYQGYAATALNEVAWRSWSSWRFGLGLEYFFTSYFKLVLDYSHVRAPYDHFIYDVEDAIEFDVDEAASTGYHQLFVIAAFQFQPQQ